jgi:hypothetical protein
MSYVRSTWSFRVIVASCLLGACADPSRDDASLSSGLEQKRNGNHDDGDHDDGNHGDEDHGDGDDGDGDGDPGDGDGDACSEDGRFAGETAALAYCQLSISLGGLAPEEPLTAPPETECSCLYEDACRQEFDRVAADFDGCAPFINGEFAEAYQSARFNQCLLLLAEPEPEPEPAPCDDGVCECRDQPECRVRAGDDADVQCVRVELCDVEADSGKVSCHHVGRCEVDCTDCDVDCRDVEVCRVDLGEGSVRCDDVGECEVECVGGGHRAPTCCSDGRHVCGQDC